MCEYGLHPCVPARCTQPHSWTRVHLDMTAMGLLRIVFLCECAHVLDGIAKARRSKSMKGRWSGGLIPNGKQFGGGGVKECICYWDSCVWQQFSETKLGGRMIMIWMIVG